jgi:1-acyl-sn-glycerol-3-phosphate acyltransferase
MKNWNYENDQWTKLPSHLKHLPLFTRHYDMMSSVFRYLWAFFMKFVFFRFYIRLKVKGDWHQLYKDNPKLLIISNHGSYWTELFIAAAKDYFFTNPVFTFFSQHCLGAIPVERGERSGDTISLILNLLSSLERIWLIIFPEGTRSRDGKVHDFKRGISLFAMRTDTPICFLYLEGNNDLWPKGAIFAKPGKLVVHIGPVHPPASIDEVYDAYKAWAMQINPHAFDESGPDQI